MKLFLKILIIFLFTVLPAQAITFDVLVLPVDLLQTKENYYGFEEVSEIIAKDVIKNFNSSNGKIKSPDLYEVRAKLNQNTNLKQTTQKALVTYKSNNKIDYPALKELSNSFSCKSVLLISGNAVTNKNSIKRNVWEVLEVSTAFKTSYPYRLEVSAVLLDNVNDLVMWSNTYSYKLGANDNVFAAKNYAQANGEYEKIKLYSENIAAKSISQNIILRFFPQTIRPIETESTEPSGGALRFDSTIPEKPKQYDLRPKADFYGDMIYGI